jgi:hypothetical protein
MCTEFEAIKKAIKISKKSFEDQIMVVYCKLDGSYDCILEAEYGGNEEAITHRYLNGVRIAYT